MRNSLLRSLVLGSVLCFVSGCGVIDMVYLPPAENTAQEIFESANDEMHDKNFVRAAELYNKLRDEYPFSPYTVNAELSLADAYFLDGEYALAVEAYKDFESLHPRHEAVPYCLYQIGMAGLHNFRSIDRATTELSESCSYFDRLMQSYPGTTYAQGAAENKAKARKKMAEHELYIADMFWNMENYGPAWRRYEYVIAQFADVKDVSEHARVKSIAAYQKYRAEQTTMTREKRQGHWKDWFSWL
jgi:outer membrane protein assembly factor BamD